MSELTIEEEEPSIHEAEPDEEVDTGLEEHQTEDTHVTTDTSGSEEEEEEEGCGFIDTAIQIQSKGGIELQRSVSNTSSVQDPRTTNMATTDSYQEREDVIPAHDDITDQVSE